MHASIVGTDDRDTAGPRTVAVALGGPRSASRAVLPGRRLAAALGVSIGAVNVVECGAAIDAARLEETVDTQHLHWSETVHAANVADGVTTCAQRRGAIVAMVTGQPGRTGAVVGATAAAVVHQATQPVLLVGPSVAGFERRPITELVVALSVQPRARAILGSAESIAHRYGFDLHVVTRDDGSSSPVGDVARLMQRRPHAILLLDANEQTGADPFRPGSIVGRIIAASPAPALMLPPLSWP